MYIQGVAISITAPPCCFRGVYATFDYVFYLYTLHTAFALCTLPDKTCFWIATLAKGVASARPLRVRRSTVNRKQAELALTVRLLSQPPPHNVAVVPFPFLSRRISRLIPLPLPLVWHWNKQFHEDEDSTTVVNLGTYARTEVKRANANPTHGESAQFPEARSAVRCVRRLACLG